MKKSEQVGRALENWRKGIYATSGICYCLCQSNLRANLRGSLYWHGDIGKMIGNYTFVSTWLEVQGIPKELLTKENMREYRELWLEHLMNYYLSIGE